MSATKTVTTETCKEAIIRDIEKQLRKGHVEGVMFHPCMSCEDVTITTNTVTVPNTRVSVFGSGVRWKSYGGGSGGKARK
jgi:hypothetical protein